MWVPQWLEGDWQQGLEEGWFGGEEDSGHKAWGESRRKSWLRLMMGALTWLIHSDPSMDLKGIQHLQHIFMQLLVCY